MNVAIVEYYIPGCGDCITIVENIVQSAIRDVTVSHTKLVATVNRHCHEVAKASPQKRVAAGAAPVEVAAAASAPSGVLFSESEVAGLVGCASNLPNGFDSERLE